MDTKLQKNPKAAVVLGSGGIRSLAELPVLEYLKSKGAPIDIIIGSGGGAVLGALFACGFSSEEIPELMVKIFNPKLFKRLNYRMLLKILGFRRKPFESPPAPYSSEHLIGVLKEIFGERRIEDLPINLQIQATDMGTGEAVGITNGLIYEALYVSNATYPFLPPLNIDGKWLVSGVFTAAIPVMQAVQENYKVIYVLSVNDTMPIAAKGMFEYVNTFFMHSFTATQGRQVALAINVHEGEVLILNARFDKVINLWDVNKIQSVVDVGKTLLEEHKAELDEAIAL